MLSQADGYPVVIKQFLQFCLILIYPAWIFAALVMFAIYYVILLPVLRDLYRRVLGAVLAACGHAAEKKNPEEYEAVQDRSTRQ